MWWGFIWFVLLMVVIVDIVGIVVGVIVIVRHGGIHVIRINWVSWSIRGIHHT